MDHVFEAHVRRLVAENLVVRFDDLTSDASFADDLATDSLDLVELALALEEEFGLTVPERTMAEVRTYGELVAATVTVARNGAEARPLVEAGDTLRAGPGVQREVTVAEDGGDAGVRQVQQQFAWLSGRGVAVDVHRDRGHRVNRAA